MSIALAIEQMTLEEKLRAMEALWEDLCRQPETVAVPQWQKDLLDERERAVERGEARFSSWEEARKRIDKRTS
jgi:hypothetical protein